jgi:hypothetical protein
MYRLSWCVYISVPAEADRPAGGSGRATSLEYLLTGFQQNPSVTL